MVLFFNVTHSEGNILSFLRLFLPSLLYMLVATSFHYYRLVFLDYSKLPLLFLSKGGLVFECLSALTADHLKSDYIYMKEIKEEKGQQEEKGASEQPAKRHRVN